MTVIPSGSDSPPSASSNSREFTAFVVLSSHPVLALVAGMGGFAAAILIALTAR